MKADKYREEAKDLTSKASLSYILLYIFGLKIYINVHVCTYCIDERSNTKILKMPRSKRLNKNEKTKHHNSRQMDFPVCCCAFMRAILSMI